MAAKHEFRDNAYAKLRAARKLLIDRDWGNATYIAGLALEILLKARICADRGLSKWPATKAECKRRGLGDLHTHDIETLLNETSLVTIIKTTLLKEWSICLQWKPDTRYYPVESVTKASANEMIAAAAAIMDELRKNPGLEFEMAAGDLSNPYARIAVLARQLAEEYGDFDFFAVWHRAGTFAGSADVVVCAPWIDAETGRGIERVVEGIQKKLAPEEMATVAGVIAVHRLHPVLQSLRNFVVPRYCQGNELGNCIVGHGSHSVRVERAMIVANPCDE